MFFSLLANTDLLVVMYYSPWSTHSNHMKHPFEVVAKFMHQPGKVMSSLSLVLYLSGEFRSYKLLDTWKYMQNII